jgi:hypothetical protein
MQYGIMIYICIQRYMIITLGFFIHNLHAP